MPELPIARLAKYLAGGKENRARRCEFCRKELAPGEGMSDRGSSEVFCNDECADNEWFARG